MKEIKPCKGCPDSVYPSAPQVDARKIPTLVDTLEGLPDGTYDGPLLAKEGVKYCDVWAVPVGNYFEDQLVSIIFAIPEGIDRIGVHPDGSIEYTKKGPDDWESPSPIDGYERDQENKWLFRPVWESCTWRHFRVALKEACQCINVLARCTANHHWVTYKDCLRCKCRLPMRTRPLIEVKTVKTLRLPDLDRNST